MRKGGVSDRQPYIPAEEDAADVLGQQFHAELNRQVRIGVVAGGVTAMVAGRWIQSLLFETAPSDPLVLASAGAVMFIIAAAATLLPARTASKADPNVLLRI